MSGGDKKKAEAPPINASSKEEEQFIQYATMKDQFWQEILELTFGREFIKAANEEGQKAKH